MTQTKKEIRTAWDKENLTKFSIAFHNTHDEELLEYIEKQKESGIKISDVFKNLIREKLAQEYLKELNQK